MTFRDVVTPKIKGIEGATEEEDDFHTPLLPRGYLSVSQITQYMKCGEAYRQRYLLGAQSPSTGPQVQGRGVHRAAEVLHLSMIAGATISKEEMAQAYSDLHDTEIKDAEIDEEDQGDSGRIKDAGITLSTMYHDAALGLRKDDRTGLLVPRIEPVAAERAFRVKIQPENSDPIPFVGFIDLEEEFAVSDLKTKKRASPQSDADDSIQLSLYAHVTGKPDVRLDQLIRPTKTKGPRFIRTRTVRTPEEIAHALDIAGEVAADIAAGRFRKSAPDTWWCTAKWCPFWSDCRGRKRQ